MCFMVLTADSDEGIDDAACHFVVGGERKKESGFSTWGEIIHISSNAPFCFCNSLNTGVIIFGLHPVTPPSHTHCGLVDFYKV